MNKKLDSQSVQVDAYLVELIKIEKMRRKFCESAVGDCKLSPSEMDVLYFLANQSKLDTAKDIADYMGISKSLVCRAVASLTEKGLLLSQVDQDDKRVVHLKILNNAYEIVNGIEKNKKAFCQKLLQDISKEEMNSFEQVLKKMKINLYK